MVALTLRLSLQKPSGLPTAPEPRSRVARGQEGSDEDRKPIGNGEAMGVVEGILPAHALPLALAV